MPTPRSIYIRKGSSSQVKLQCLATVMTTARFRTKLSDDQLEPHFRIIAAPTRKLGNRTGLRNSLVVLT